MIFANTDFVNGIIHILWQSIDITNTSLTLIVSCKNMCTLDIVANDDFMISEMLITKSYQIIKGVYSNIFFWEMYIDISHDVFGIYV